MRLSDLDASFLYRESLNAPMHSASISLIEGVVATDLIKKQVSSKLHRIPRYRQKLAFIPLNIAHPVWVDDLHFDLNKHIREDQLPADSNLDSALDRALQLAEQLLPRDRPLWSMTVIHGVPNLTVLVHFAHHAMIDGASGVDISNILFDIQKQAPLEEAPDWQPQPAPDSMVLAADAIAESTLKFTTTAQRLNNSNEERSEMLRRATETLSRFIDEPVLRTPWNAHNVGIQRRFCWRSYALGEVRKIRNALGGTENDIVLAITVEAAARYTQDKAADTDGQHLRVMCPVDVRRQDESGALSNRISATFPVFDAAPMDAEQRLQEVRWETESIKQSREAQALHLLAELAPPTPPSAMIAGQFLATQLAPAGNLWQSLLPMMPSFMPSPPVGFNFTCSNLPGVQTTQYIAGHPVLDHLAVLMLTGNLGYSVGVLTYDQKIYFNMVSDLQLLPDLETMAGYVDEVFRELSALALTQKQTNRPSHRSKPQTA